MGALQDGLVQVDFEGQRPRVLAALRRAQGDGNDGWQGEGARAIQVLQVLLVPIDAQRLEERQRGPCSPGAGDRTLLSPDWEHRGAGWGRTAQHGHAGEPSTVVGDHKHCTATSQPCKAHPAAMGRPRVLGTPAGPPSGCAEHLSPRTWVLTCCSGAVTKLAQLSHSITMMERKRQAARIQRGRPERL